MSFEFDFTFQKLQIVLAGAPHLDSWYAALNEILPDYEINTVQRVGCFLGQTAHESGNYRAIRENLNYRAEGLIHIFGSHFPGGLAEAKQYEHDQERIANRIYANRMGNGAESSGDGFKFRGRGLIQLTGRENYQFFADSIGEDIESIPAFLETFEGAVQSACYFWESAKLNALADTGNIKGMTKVINGGTLGLVERTSHIKHAIQVLGS